MEDMLQRFLDAGMLDVGEDDSRLEQLHAAAHDVAASFATDRSRVIAHTLVALDPEVPPDEPMLTEIESAVKKHWKSFRNRFAGDPRQVLRAVELEALRAAGESDADTAAVVWLIGGSYLPYARLDREESICRELLVRMGEIFEEAAEEEWSNDYHYKPPNLPNPKVDVSGFKAPLIDQDELTKHLLAAAGPSNAASTEIGDEANIYSPNSNPAYWSSTFAPRAARGISEVIDQSHVALFKKVSETVGKTNGGLKEYAAALSDAFGESVESVMRSAATNKRREKLLWWKETLYSPALKQSYRSLEGVPAALAMAYDLHTLVPERHPQSVEYLLRETMRQIASTLPSVTLLEACERLRSGEMTRNLTRSSGRESGTSAPVRTNLWRCSLLDYVESILDGGSLNAGDLERRLGIDAEIEVRSEELSVWLFRDFQARRLTVGR